MHRGWVSHKYLATGFFLCFLRDFASCIRASEFHANLINDFGNVYPFHRIDLVRT